MYVIILGLGGIGRSLTALAAEHGDNVVIVDQDEERCNEVLEKYDVMAVIGNATDKAILTDAGIDRAEAFIATTHDDAVNLMACWHAKKMKVRNVISIVNHREHSDFFREVGVKVSEDPDELVAARLYYWTLNPQLWQLATIPGGSIFEIVAEEGSPMADRQIRDMKVKDYVIIAVKRAGGEVIIPSGSVTIRAGDTLTIFTKQEDEQGCLALLNKQLRRNG
jgi:trk system potassium uptake protein TrkA